MFNHYQAFFANACFEDVDFYPIKRLTEGDRNLNRVITMIA